MSTRRPGARRTCGDNDQMTTAPFPVEVNGRRWAWAAIRSLVMAAALAGCGSLPGPTPSPSQEASHDPICAPALHATRSPDQMATSDAQPFRDRVGLESGRDWILAVYADGSSVTAFGHRLLPCERDALEGRPRDSTAVALAIDSYAAAYRDEFGGSYLAPGGTSVVLFTRQVEEHERAIRRLVHPSVTVVVRSAQWAYHELEALRDRIGFEHDWFAGQGAQFDSVGIDPAANQVVLRVLSNELAIGDRIRLYYDAGSQLRVEVKPDDLSLLPRGTLRGRAIDEDGRPVAEMVVDLVPDVPGAGQDSEIGTGTGPTGLFSFENIHAVGYEVQLLRFEGNDWIVVASRRAVVPANDTVFVEIVVPSH